MAKIAQPTGAASPVNHCSAELAVETAAARTRAAFRDITHYTRLLFSGPDHLDVLHRLTTNHFLRLPPGDGLVAVFPDNRGRIVSCGSFTRLDGEYTLLVIPSSNGGRLVEWLNRYIFNEKISIRDLTPETAAMEVIGPESTRHPFRNCPGGERWRYDPTPSPDLNRRPEAEVSRAALWPPSRFPSYRGFC